MQVPIQPFLFTVAESYHVAGQHKIVQDLPLKAMYNEFAGITAANECAVAAPRTQDTVKN